MKEFIPDQLRAVFAFFLSGVAFGVFRDVLRFFGMICGAVSVPERRKKAAGGSERKSSSALGRFLGGAAVFFADVLFCLLVTAVFAVMTYAFCGGRFRSYSFFSAAAGFYLYSVLPGKAFRIPLEWGAFRLRRAIRAAARFVSAPLRFVISAVRRNVSGPLVLYFRKLREARRLKRSERQNGAKRSPDDAREAICSVGRRKTH